MTVMSIDVLTILSILCQLVCWLRGNITNNQVSIKEKIFVPFICILALFIAGVWLGANVSHCHYPQLSVIASITSHAIYAVDHMAYTYFFFLRLCDVFENTPFQISRKKQIVFYSVFICTFLAMVLAVSLDPRIGDFFYPHYVFMGLSAVGVIYLDGFVLYSFIKGLVRVISANTATVAGNAGGNGLENVVVKLLMLYLLSIIASFLVFVYVVVLIVVKESLIWETIINSFVFRLDLMTNVVALLYTAPNFDTWYDCIFGTCAQMLRQCMF